MKIETVMWLLPVVFMLHDFEEIIMMKAWIGKHAPSLKARFPKLALRMLPHIEKLSTAAFALAVAEEFLLLALLTLISVELALYSLWTGIMLGFFIHLVVHLGQWIVFGRYIPAIWTSIASMAYCMFVLYDMNARHLLVWGEVLIWTFVATGLIAANILFCHGLAARFAPWLEKFRNNGQGDKG